MIELDCNNCGAALEVTKDNFIVVGDIVIQTCNKFKCRHCGTMYARSEQFKLHVEVEAVETMNVDNVEAMNISKANVVVNTGGGAYIGGTVKLAPGTDFVGRDKVVIMKK